MPVKTVAHRKTKIKSSVSKEDESAEIVSMTKKNKMAAEIDEPETIGNLEDKNDEDLEITDEESDELGLDDAGLEEEIDPFNDKWEA
ncbi:MAG: hypothetical protein KGI59_02445 [Patescibacteria group bacterium]|nr:hypothetical protein [Patescibacteria group bacterium]MDE2172869.1 hypothetical protein [Patescibacteria group bacterium]